jgi:hypothetical protein
MQRTEDFPDFEKAQKFFKFHREAYTVNRVTVTYEERRDKNAR